MSNKTRKRIWPVSLMAAIAAVAMLAVVAATVWTPGAAQAQAPVVGPGGLQATADSDSQITLTWNAGLGHTTYELQRSGGGPFGGGYTTVSNAIAVNATTYQDTGLDANTRYTYRVRGVSAGGETAWSNEASATTNAATIDPTEPVAGAITSSSTSAGAGTEVKVVIDSFPHNATAGSSVVLYLEDDYQVPDSIDKDNVYFTVKNADGTDPDADQNGGGRVYITDPIEVNDDNHFGGDDDWDIRVFIPDMNDADDTPYNGPEAGQKVTLTFTKAAGIKNPTEAHDSKNDYADGFKASYAVLDADDSVPDAPEGNTVDDLIVKAKISLSDEDNSRGYELTVTGSGFNNGTSAGVYVLNRMPAGDTDLAKAQDVIANGILVGDAEVGGDDKAAVTFEVTVPTFMAGDGNYIVMVDGEGRASFDDIEQFELEPSIRVVPSTVSAGDTVNVFAQDFPTVNASFDSSAFKLAGQTMFNGRSIGATGDGIGRDHSATATFVVPGGLKGIVRVDAKWGDTSENTKITIAPSSLTLSKEEVSANESITIRGSGFGDGAGCLESATISGAELVLISDDDVSGTDCIDVEVSSAGQFAATVAIWSDGSTNPALTPGTHTIEVKDDEGFTGSATIVIKEPTLMVSPDVAGPRDYITISGTNWPVENDEGGNIEEVKIDIGNGLDDEDADPDASGRWSVTYRVDGDVTIPSTVQVKATYGEGSEIVEVASFSVPAATLTVSPTSAGPGDTVTLSATGFSLFESDIEVKIGSVRVNVPDGTVTGRDGEIEGLEVIVPALDPALYTVQLKVDETVTIGELTVLDDSVAGTATALPDAVSDLGDNLEAIFHFNNTSKEWTFYDPRPEFADLNTLNELNSGQPYWILVGESQEGVNWNNRLVNFTCAADDCWNLEIW